MTVGAPVAVRPLRQGDPGEIGIPVRNPGTVAVEDLVATVDLPAGFTVRAGRSARPADWTCTGTGTVATCRVSVLAAGGSGTLRLKVFAAEDAAAASITGSVTAAPAVRAAIPTTVLPVRPK